MFRPLNRRAIHVCVLLGYTFSNGLFAADPVRAVLTQRPDRSDAPGITLKEQSGKSIDLKSYKGKVVLVDFWATWCGGCKQELPWFQEFAVKYGRRGFSVLAVSVDEEGWPVVRRFVDPLKLRFKVVIDDTDTAKRYDLKEMPAAFLIDRNGRVATKYIGLVDRADLEANIRTLLSERETKRKR